jgi:hypothetical protein
LNQPTVACKKKCKQAVFSAKHGVRRPKSGVEPVPEAAWNGKPGVLTTRLTLHTRKEQMLRIVSPFNLLLFSSERPQFLKVSTEKHAIGMIHKSIFFYKRSPSELRLSAVEGCSCLFSCGRFFLLSFLILATSDLGIKTIVPQKKPQSCGTMDL